MAHGPGNLPQDGTACRAVQDDAPRDDLPGDGIGLAAHAPAPPSPTDGLPLPENLASAHALIGQLASSLGELQDSRQELQQEVEALKLMIAKLLLRLAGHRSERFAEGAGQTHLDFGDNAAMQDGISDAAVEAEQIVEEYLVRRKLKQPKPPRHEQLPAHLPRYQVELPAPGEVTHCPTHGPRQRIGEDVLETLEFERPKLRVRQTIIPKYVCSAQPECGVREPERPRGLVEGNRFDTSIGAEIITAKYAYHLPVYRHQDYFAGSGWTPSRSTLLNIMTAAANVLLPLYDHYRRVMLCDAVVGTDETSVTLILPPEIPPVRPGDPRSKRIHEVFTEARAKKQTSVAAKMWAYRAVQLPVNVFDFTVSRHRDGVDEMLKDYTGTLMADCYSGYQNIELRSDSRIRRAACWAHARRKVFDARENQPLEARVLLAMIGELYDIEERGKRMSAEERRALRQREARPVMARIRLWLDSPAATRVLPKSLLGEALRYLRNQWELLQVYLSDGRIPIDNNDTEQLMKQVALGRKNWLFIGSVVAGHRAAVLMTMVSTAHRNDLDVWAYLKDVLDRLLAGETDYHSLRADIWKQAHPEHVRVYRQTERRDRSDVKRLRRARRRLLERAKSRSP